MWHLDDWNIAYGFCLDVICDTGLALVSLEVSLTRALPNLVANIRCLLCLSWKRWTSVVDCVEWLLGMRHRCWLSEEVYLTLAALIRVNGTGSVLELVQPLTIVCFSSSLCFCICDVAIWTPSYSIGCLYFQLRLVMQVGWNLLSNLTLRWKFGTSKPLFLFSTSISFTFNPVISSLLWFRFNRCVIVCLIISLLDTDNDFRFILLWALWLLIRWYRSWSIV